MMKKEFSLQQIRYETTQITGRPILNKGEKAE